MSRHREKVAKVNIRSNIDEGRLIVERLLTKPPIPFSGPTMYEIPEKSGIYAFSHRTAKKVVYVGQSGKDRSKKGTLRSRMVDHWYGTESSDMAKKLVVKEVVRDVTEGRDWTKGNVDIRWMMSDEFNMDIGAAERFAIQELHPPLNTQFKR